MNILPTPSLKQKALFPSDTDAYFYALQKYWGYSAFRPKQEEIVRALSAGRDCCVVMPTGGGKSLCYQLPAVLAERRTALVISPLIALMQDQVAQLRQMGIPAAFLNSAVADAIRSEVKRKAAAGEYRLMYVSPERAVMDGADRWLSSIPISFFAIDEAHCISEWGHDFRPEYRQLRKLRELFPQMPIAAFTASATRQVRHDIVDQLRLRDPFKSVSSFRRDNLRYLVKKCPGDLQEEILLAAVQHVADGNVIVYSPTIARVGETIDLLAEHGIAAVGYHGQMDSATRRTNQERWMNEEVRVLVGTIAFGLGINKPNVRAVIRLGLPESIEQLYQETGRAGRDGSAANCYVLWQRRDNALRAHFINQISSSREKGRAWERYDKMQQFVKSRECRQKLISEHFGEAFRGPTCGTCDACGGAPRWFVATQPTVERRSKPEVRQRFKQDRRASHAAEQQVYEAATEPPLNEELREFLREWRRDVARENMIAAFVVMHDSTLEELCRAQPKTMPELRAVSGMGAKKCEVYGETILATLRRFANGQRASKEWEARPKNPSEETLELLRKGHSFEEIAQLRGRKVSTVVVHVADLVEKGKIGFEESWIPAARVEQIRAACARNGMEWMKPIKDALPQDFSHDEIRLVMAQCKREKAAAVKALNKKPRSA